MVRQKTGLDTAGLLQLVDVVVVTHGAGGSTVIGRDFRLDVPAVRSAKVVEPTGVGDAYRAGLLTGLVRGYSWDVTCRLASVAAVYVVESIGTMNHRYRLADFVARYRAEYGDTPELADLLSFSAAGAAMDRPDRSYLTV